MKPTMESRLLNLLSRQWVTPLDALREVNCLSLSQRCGEFDRQGHTILKAWVKLQNGKRVMSYRLSKARAK